VTPVTPTPRTLYIHDDLFDELRAAGESSPVWPLARALLRLFQEDQGRIVVLTLASQLEGVLAQGAHAPFAATVGIGAAGVRVAAALHARTGWFPAIHRVDVWREEDGRGGYVIAGPAPLARQLHPLADEPSVAVVDDTVFSGQTMRTVLEALPPGLRGRAHAFCLRAVGDSLPAIRQLAPVTAGFTAPGRILEDVSFINASGLVRRIAIRRAGQPPLAFFDRPEWMAAWFPGYAREVTALCRELNAQLEPAPRS